MLGKGLESLIPPKGGSASPGSPRDAGSSPPLSPRDGTALPPEKEERETPPQVPRAMRRPTAEGDAIFHIEVEKMAPNPLQPRRDFNEENLRELADSIREFGILQPLVVSKIEKETERGTEVAYQLIAGERRLMAAKILGMERVPVVIRKVEAEGEKLQIAIIENLQRQNLNPIETARGLARLQDEFRLTQREIAARLGKSRETVANTLRLLDLPSHIQAAAAKGQISESHARLLLAVPDAAAQEALFRDLLDRHLTTRELKYRVEAEQGGARREGSLPQPALPPELASLQEKLSSELGAPVKIETRGSSPAGGGKITITFYSGEELKNIIEKLGKEKEGF